MQNVSTASAPSHLQEVGRELRANWVLVLTAAIGMGTGLAAIPIYTLGAFTKPLAEAFNWSRADVQGIYSWITIGNLAAAPILGILIDKYGIRRLTLFSILATATGLFAFGTVTGPLWSFYLVGFLTAVFGVGTVPITWTRAMIGAFDRGRGLALGLALSGSGVAAVCLPSYVTWLMDNWSWRGAYIGLGLLPLLLSFPFAYFFLHETTHASHVAAAEVAKQTAPAKPDGTLASFASFMSNYRFWIIIVSFFVAAAATAGMIAHFIPIVTDGGLSRTSAAKVAGVIGLAVVFGRVVTGLLIDRYWAPAVAAIALILPVGSCLLLVYHPGDHTWGLVAAVGIGLAAGAEFDLMSYLVSQYFDRAKYGIIYGTLYACCKFAGGMAAPLFGLSFDKTGTYTLTLFAALGCFALASALMLTLGPYKKT